MTSAHVGELKLRRFRAGELAAEDASLIATHTQECGTCRAKLRAFDEEQRSFEAAIPFERFAAGVERAARRPGAAPARSLRWLAPVLSIAAGLFLVLTAAPVIRGTLSTHGNRTKGGADVVLKIAAKDNGPQREASAQTPEPLGLGERVRIGYKGGGHRYVASVSIDEQGEVTALYPEEGRSLAAAEGSELEYLPNSLEVTGRGLEQVVVVLSDEPLEVEALKAAARGAYEKAGSLARMGKLDVPGEQFSRTVLKP